MRSHAPPMRPQRPSCALHPHPPVHAPSYAHMRLHAPPCTSSRFLPLRYAPSRPLALYIGALIHLRRRHGTRYSGATVHAISEPRYTQQQGNGTQLLCHVTLYIGATIHAIAAPPQHSYTLLMESLGVARKHYHSPRAWLSSENTI